MEENVALDSNKQKQFVKSIKGIKKKLNKNTLVIPTADKVVASEIKEGKTKKRKIKEKGLVYLAHIPHGFYENEMTQYFKQFGMVTNVRVIRSKRTGNSKGYAFVEFKEPSVAQIVAETMNNYLMGKRLLKAAYIPPEKQKHHAMRKKWNPLHNPGRDGMIKQKKAYNADKNDTQDLEIARRTLSNINKTKEKLRELGIDYDFFTPVDVPEELESEITPKNKDKQKLSKNNKTKNDAVEIVVQTNKVKKGKTEAKKEDKNTKGKKVDQASNLNSKQQKQKEQKLKEKGVKPAENFISVQKDSDDESDSSLDFDSDEYEKLMENEDDSLGSEHDESESEGGSDDDDNSESNSGEESEEEELPKIPLVINPNKVKNQQTKKNKEPQVKRRAVPVEADPTPKKSKFEKQQKNPQFAKKQFKKKK